MQTKVLPHNTELEQCLLASLLIDNRKYDVIANTIQAQHFFIPVHQRIYTTISEYLCAGKQATAVTLKHIFTNDPDLVELGGAEYISDLMASVVSSVNIEQYAKTVKDLYDRRELSQLAEWLSDKAHSGSVMGEDVLAYADEVVTSLSHSQVTQSQTASVAASSALKWMRDVADGKIKPIHTGYRILDDKVGGFFGGSLYVIAGRPGMGKTALMLNLADNISQHSTSIVVSLEMRAEELGMRLMSARTGISVGDQRQASRLTPDNWRALMSAQEDLQKSSLIIEDCPTMNIAVLKTMARRYKRIHGKFTLFIDYLGLIEMDKKIQSKVYQVEEVTRNLKSLAKELDVPVILLCQLNRSVESREDTRPVMSDLRDSGSIEQDADAILFPYREEYYKQRKEPRKKENEGEAKFLARMADHKAELGDLRGQAEIIIAKNRQGTEGKVLMKFNGVKQRFYE